MWDVITIQFIPHFYIKYVAGWDVLFQSTEINEILRKLIHR